LPREKRSGFLNLQLLLTRPSRCAVRAHWIKFAVHGEFTLPTAANSASRKGKFTSEKKKRCLNFSEVLGSNAGLAFDLLHLSRAIESGQFSRAFRKKLFEPACFLSERVLFAA
jgi:hypothetical protein